ncbi:hypothetical protein T05_8809 [Trichinella murrelli]|uniref:Uncharacterized protein n=1 Tax=Trichinella murrelli TaxID=144512 RepID=A0A0V0TQY2_9BILA|nr:hypothetical protein T05_8809 [Trichinella murrelli]
MEESRNQMCGFDVLANLVFEHYPTCDIGSESFENMLENKWGAASAA